MKVLVVTGIFPPDSGGPANYVPAFTTALAREHEVLGVVTLSDALDHDDSLYPFPVFRIRRGAARRRIETISLIARLSAKADVVYLNGLVLEGMLAVRRRRPTVIKVVGDMIWERARTQHATELEIDAFQEPGGKPLKWRALHWLQSSYTRAANFVITPSLYLAELVRGWGVAPAQIRVVYNAVQPPPPEPAAAPSHDVVTVARLAPWKGIEALIDVCAASDWSLLVVGDGPQRAALETRAKSLAARVTFTGRASGSEVANLIRRGRVFVLNSSYEGLPHVVLEAKLAGRPVVATRVGGTPEAIHDGIDGYLVAAGDNADLAGAIARLLDDEAHRAAIAEAGLRDAEARFLFEKMYRDTLDVLQAAARAP
jgi:glycosyltransferase involved in cell wall biosynthesis